MADLVQRMEGDLTDSISEETYTGTMYGDVKNEVSEFDALVSTAENNNDTRHASQVGFVEPIELVYQYIYIIQLSSSMKVNDRSATVFRLGDVEN